MSCASLLQHSPNDWDLHQKFCISSSCCYKQESVSADAGNCPVILEIPRKVMIHFTELCLKPSKAHMNLLEWDFSSLEIQLDSSSDSGTIEKACIEDLHCPSPTTSCQSASSLHSITQESNINFLVNSSVSANSLIDKSDPIDEKSDSIPQATSRFKFTRSALQKRLQNLVNLSLKNVDDPEVKLTDFVTDMAVSISLW